MGRLPQSVPSAGPDHGKGLQEAGADPALLADIRLLPLVLLPLAIAVAILQAGWTT